MTRTMSLSRFTVSTVLTIVCCVSTSANEFYRIETPIPYTLTLGEDISADGSVAIGRINWAGPGIYWTPEDGRVVVSPPAPYDRLDFSGVSGDGEIIVGRLTQDSMDESYTPFKYMVATGEIELLPRRDDFELTSAGIVSGDGTVVWGTARLGGDIVNVVWREGEDVQVLDFDSLGIGEGIAAAPDNALWLFADGVYYPFEDRVGMRSLPQPPDSLRIRAVSSSGDVAAGTANEEAARWDLDGEVELLGKLPGFERSGARGISSDGKLVFGEVRDPPNGPQEIRAVIWDAHHGMRQLEEALLEEYGLETHPWGMQRIGGMSEDRMTITGYSRENRAASGSDGEMWVVQLDWPLGTRPGDINFDDELEVSDVDVLQRLIREERFNLQADFDRNDVVDNADLSFWVEELKQTRLGDANLDGKVAFDDFLVLSSNFNTNGSWVEGDFDSSGIVDFPDFLLLSDNFGHSAVAASIAVPEPSSGFALLANVLLILTTYARSVFQTGRPNRFTGSGIRDH